MDLIHAISEGDSGSSTIAYRRIGYRISERGLSCFDGLKRTSTLRSNVMLQLKRLFLFNCVSSGYLNQRSWKSTRLNVAVHICCRRTAAKGEARWRLEWHPVENGLPVLICLADQNPAAVTDYYLIPKLLSSTLRNTVLRKDHPLLRSGRYLESLSPSTCPIAIANPCAGGKTPEYVGLELT